MLEHRDTYGQAQVCSKGRQGSSVDRSCQPSVYWINFWHVRNPLPQSIRLRLSVLRYWPSRDIDLVKEARGVVKVGEGQNQIPFCVVV